MIRARARAAPASASPSSNARRSPTAAASSYCHARRAASSPASSSPAGQRKAEVTGRAAYAEQQIGHRVEISLLQRSADELVDGKLACLPCHHAGAGEREGNHVAPWNFDRRQARKPERQGGTTEDVQQPPRI